MRTLASFILISLDGFYRARTVSSTGRLSTRSSMTSPFGSSTKQRLSASVARPGRTHGRPLANPTGPGQRPGHHLPDEHQTQARLFDHARTRRLVQHLHHRWRSRRGDRSREKRTRWRGARPRQRSPHRQLRCRWSPRRVADHDLPHRRLRRAAPLRGPEGSALAHVGPRGAIRLRQRPLTYRPSP